RWPSWPRGHPFVQGPNRYSVRPCARPLRLDSYHLVHSSPRAHQTNRPLPRTTSGQGVFCLGVNRGGRRERGGNTREPSAPSALSVVDKKEANSNILVLI